MAWIDRFRAKPPAPDRPKASSGRGHTNGFLEYDELNARLVGESGIRKIDEMWRTDGDVRKAWLMCVNPIVGATWEVDPYAEKGKDPTPEDEEVASFVEWNLREFMRPALPAHLLETMRVLRAGFVPFEQVYTRAAWNGRDVLALKRLGLILPRTVQRFVDDGGELQAIQMFAIPRDGGPSDPTVGAEDLVYYRLGAEGDNWEGESALRPAYKHWKYKNALELVDAIAHERFAVGIPVAYSDGLQPEAEEALEDALAGIRANEQGYIAVKARKQPTSGPQEGATALIEILQPAKPHDVQASLSYHAARISASVIEEFMRLGQEQVGARATADVQQDPFYSYLEAIATTVVEPAINEQLIPRLVALNFSTDRLPRLRCSLLDSTSLTELADYAQKLSTAGILHGDDQTEDYLRDRADLPPADPEAREERKAQAEEMRKATAEAAADPERDNQPPNQPKKPAVDPSGKKLARSGRAPRPFEQAMELDRIESVLDGAREGFVAAAREVSVALAERYATLAANGKRPPAGVDPDLREAISGELFDLYATGRDTVREELLGQAQPTLALASAEEGAAEHLEARAGVAAESVQAAVWTEVSRAALGSEDVATIRVAGEAAARGALRSEAQQVASEALNLGRAHEADANRELIRGAYYTSILDATRCPACASADDDVLRALDDPVLRANQPPNPNCEGGGRCRCLLAYVLDEESIPSA